MKIKFQLLYYFIRGLFTAKFRRFHSKEKLIHWQKTQFKRLQKKALIHSPFYQPYSKGVLADYPKTNKKQHMANFNLINTQRLDRDQALDIAIYSEKNRDFNTSYGDYSVGLSSGTSGNRGLFVASAAERAEWAGYIIGKMLPLVCYQHRIAFFLRANNKLYETTNNSVIDFHFFDLIHSPDSHIHKLNALNPTVLIAPAQILLQLAQLPKQQLSISPKKIISVAEVLDKNDQAIIKDRFNQTIHQIYQCTEGFLACTCRYGHLHLNEDLVIIEKHWLDKKSGRFMPVVTDFRRYTQPIIRYQLDDILIIETQACPCGSPFTRIKAIEGRCDDIFKMRSLQGELQSIYPDFIRNNLIASHSELEEYRVIQHDIDMIEIQIHPYSEVLINAVQTNLTFLWRQLKISEPHYQFSKWSASSALNKQRRIQSLIKEPSHG